MILKIKIISKIIVASDLKGHNTIKYGLLEFFVLLFFFSRFTKIESSANDSISRVK